MRALTSFSIFTSRDNPFDRCYVPRLLEDGPAGKNYFFRFGCLSAALAFFEVGGGGVAIIRFTASSKVKPCTRRSWASFGIKLCCHTLKIFASQNPTVIMTFMVSDFLPRLFLGVAGIVATIEAAQKCAGAAPKIPFPLLEN